MPRILIIEDSPTQALRFARMLEEGGFEVEKSEQLADGIKRIQQGGIEALLLDLTLPDSQGLKTFFAARLAAPETPLVVLTNLDDEAMAETALQHGAQDYLVKSEVNQNWLVRSVQHAIARGAPKQPAKPDQPVLEERSRQLLDVTRDHDITVVRLQEKRLLDAGDIALMGETLIRMVESGCRKMLISFAGVDYVSNGFMSVLLAVRRKMQMASGALCLCELSESVHEHLSVRQFHKLFEIRDREPLGLQSFETDGPLRDRDPLSGDLL
ncbi:MAG: response regulator [Pirellulaceae bacterium]